MSYDHYSETRSLIERLQSEGYTAWATRLQKSMDQGATGTEIFMALHWHFEQFLDADVACSDVIVLKAKVLHKELERALSRQDRK